MVKLPVKSQILFPFVIVAVSEKHKKTEQKKKTQRAVLMGKIEAIREVEIYISTSTPPPPSPPPLSGPALHSV